MLLTILKKPRSKPLKVFALLDIGSNLSHQDYRFQDYLANDRLKI